MAWSAHHDYRLLWCHIHLILNLSNLPLLFVWLCMFWRQALHKRQLASGSFRHAVPLYHNNYNLMKCIKCLYKRVFGNNVPAYVSANLQTLITLLHTIMGTTLYLVYSCVSMSIYSNQSSNVIALSNLLVLCHRYGALLVAVTIHKLILSCSWRMNKFTSKSICVLANWCSSSAMSWVSHNFMQQTVHRVCVP